MVRSKSVGRKPNKPEIHIYTAAIDDVCIAFVALRSQYNNTDKHLDVQHGHNIHVIRYVQSAAVAFFLDLLLKTIANLNSLLVKLFTNWNNEYLPHWLATIT